MAVQKIQTVKSSFNYVRGLAKAKRPSLAELSVNPASFKKIAKANTLETVPVASNTKSGSRMLESDYASPNWCW